MWTLRNRLQNCSRIAHMPDLVHTSIQPFLVQKERRRRSRRAPPPLIGLCCGFPFAVCVFAWRRCARVVQDRGEDRDCCGVFDPFG